MPDDPAAPALPPEPPSPPKKRVILKNGNARADGRGRCAYRREMWERLLASYREFPHNDKRAALAAGCGYKAAKAAWSHAVNGGGERFDAIKDVLEEEKRQARLKVIAEEEALEKKREEEQAKITRDAIQQQSEEAAMCRVARHNTLTTLAMDAQIVVARKRLIERTCAILEKPDVVFSVPMAMDLIAQMSQFMHKDVIAVQRAMEIERLRLGEPTAIVEMREEKPLSIEEELQRDIDRGLTALRVKEAQARARELCRDMPPEPPAPPASDQTIDV